jgi:hypothetical protein
MAIARQGIAGARFVWIVWILYKGREDLFEGLVDGIESPSIEPQSLEVLLKRRSAPNAYFAIRHKVIAEPALLPIPTVF